MTSTTSPSSAGDPRTRLSGLRVLVADDAADNRTLMSRILSLAGATVDVAFDGIEAIAKALDAPYDVVLMDIQMPGADGYEATARLRKQGYTRPIIALTAHAMKEERERCLAAGCDHHLSKPVERQKLIASIEFFTRRRLEENPLHVKQ